jgi:hypothetical protein
VKASPPPFLPPNGKGVSIVETCTFSWIPSINFLLLLVTDYMIVLLFADLRRIEKRYESLLHPGRPL